jgi:spermidine synthase
MPYLDHSLQYKKDLLNKYYEVISNRLSSEGIIYFNKGNLNYKFESITKLQEAIKKLETEIFFLENGTNRKCLI